MMIPPPVQFDSGYQGDYASGLRRRRRRSREQVGGSSPHLLADPASAGSVIGPCVYLLRSRTTGAFYLGATANLARRLQSHARGHGGRYSSTHGPWELVAYEMHTTLMAARRREQTLKRNNRMRFLFTKRALATPHGQLISSDHRQVGG